jgi:ABC-type oligopeptide transport system, periplasmic component
LTNPSYIKTKEKVKRMKRILTSALAFALIMSLLAGCSGGTKTTPAPSPAQSGTQAPDSQQYMNVLLAPNGTSADPSVLDVVRFPGMAERTVLYNILEPLTRIQDGKLVPAGAKKWDISSDGLEYTFYLNNNFWSDGKKVTAQDYAYAIQRQSDPANAFAFASDIYCIKNFKAIFTKTPGAGELGVKAVDESTLKITLDFPSPSLLTTFDFFPLRQDQVEKYGAKLGTEADNTLSCGPFVLSSWVHSSELNFTKNDKYWDAANVKLQKFTFKIITDSAAQYASFENKSIDTLSLSDTDYVKKFQQNKAMTGKLVDTARTAMFIFNCEDSVFKNVKVRQAFSLAVDRDGILNAVNNGLGKSAYGLIPESSSVGSLNYRGTVEEPLKALAKEKTDPKALLSEGLKELGLDSDPSKLTVSLNIGATSSLAKTSGEFYQQMWQSKLGVKVTLNFNDNATNTSLLKSGKYQIAAYSWGANLDPQFQLTRWVGGGLARWKNSEFDIITQQAIKTNDEKERLKLYSDAEKILIYKEAAIAPTVYQNTMKFSYNYVKGQSFNPFDTVGMKNVYTAGR